MPSCSVIIPCYNGARFLPATLGSLLEQTRPPDEIIVVDDGSTDDSGEVASRFSPRVQLLRQTNRGESVARNAGLRAAGGEYVVFLDADDLLAPEAIERSSAAVESVPGAVAVLGVVLFTDDRAVPLDHYVPTFTGFFPMIIRTNFGPPHCWFTPRNLAMRVGGFREDLVHSEDWEFWGRIALTGAPLVCVPYEGALYRKHAHSQVSTSRKSAIVRGRLLVCETLAAGILAQPTLLGQVGDVLFWSMWAMLRQARRDGVPPQELRNAETLLETIARHGPTAVRRSLFAKAVRHLGFRTADRLHAAVDSRSLHQD
jgi:GT2 family glycosyltransferase